MDETDERGDVETEGGGDAKTERGEDEGATEDGGDETVTSSDPDERTLGTAVITIAADRSLEADAAGNAITEALENDGFEIATREHIDTDHDRVQSIVSRMIDRDDVDVIITGGATSVEPDDVTIEAVEPLLDKELTAFPQLFATLAYEAVGSRAVASRTLAGVADGVPLFCLPGDEAAARLGTEKLILPEAAYLAGIARAERDERDHPSSDDESAVDETDNGQESATDAEGELKDEREEGS
ncbi:MogA/MoaB family molybdenum cofactor biosynthesis protein [Natronorubrum sp. JWXQ-INN-674]|uniref:MogA/MoaB family molybdenum cofactor biosynthesis protein n=1 Tax=Natronorubrum halalkaliphilum TaxID=2691917 RepID=A0A6B0VQX7_9EURY|nr:molybdopterin-binding protein [Natronorubrum halalkaliphilum]MXV63467.1 MogA/MoaB family molybdenum cofactor biosynthesis protein [Natronorubrum halalkaliphilum]